MTTKYDIAKGFSRRLSSAQAAGSVWQDPDAYNVRWGTVTAINEDGTVDVLLDGSETPITIELDYTVAVGDRISLSTQGGVYQAEPTGTMESSLAAKIAAEGARISAEVNADFEEFEATHDLSEYATTAQLEQTASSLSASVTGALETANASMQKATVMEADLSGVKTEVSTMFEEDGVGSKYVDSAIEQASGTITQTVTDSVTNSIGETYATKTLVQQTANSVKTTIESDVSDTYETKAHLATMIVEDSSGITIGKSDSTIKATYTNNGLYIKRNNQNCLSIGSNGTQATISSVSQQLYIANPGWSYLNLKGTLDIGSAYGVSVNGYATVEDEIVSCPNTTSTTNYFTILPSSSASSASYIVIYYRANWGGGQHKSVRVRAGATYVDLEAMGNQSSGLIVMQEKITLSFSGTSMKITRSTPHRSALSTVVTSNTNPSDACFYIDYIGVCY